jgi:hypothetical protein
MLWVPVLNELLLRFAFPVLSRLAIPRVVVPSLKRTAPVGLPLLPCVVTVALKVTLWPRALGLGELVSIVTVAALFTICETVADVEPTKLESPA